ncbi:MAG: hypothetical protein GX913_00705 [Clostridiales bacterium]|nr:hypothetical protein [Clostridiales bacterium]
MGIFGGQFSNVVEWEEYRDDVLFWKWNNKEIKKGSKLIIRPGQDAIFMYNGKIEGIFTDEGSFDIASEIVPFLSTLKGFKFGFNSGMRAEVLFINTKEFTVKWGTKNEINIPIENLNLPGGLPIRAFGNFSCKISDHQALIDKIAGIKKMFTIDDVKERVLSKLDQLLMKWIVKEGKDIADLMATSFDISKGIREDLDMEMIRLGITITDFNIQSFSYPPEIQEKIQKVASHSMVGDLGRYQNISMVDAMADSKGGTGSGAADMATSMAGMQMGMMMGKQMAHQMENQSNPSTVNNKKGGAAPNFCPNCGTKTGGTNFCSSCGTKLV